MAGEHEYPIGWLMRAHRYLLYSKDEYGDAMELFNEAHRKKSKNRGIGGNVYFTSERDVVFGKYDRIQIEPIQDFTTFERKTNWVHDWMGSNQSILFFKWNQRTENRRFQTEIDKDGTPKMVIFGAEQTDIHFIAASFCYLSDKVRDLCRDISYNQILDYCEQRVLSLVRAFNRTLKDEGNSEDNRLHSEVIAEVFGTMSAAEFVILWSAKQYTDIMYLVDCIRDFILKGVDGDTHLLRTTDTLISFPDTAKFSSNKPEQAPILQDILGDACLQFATQEGSGEKTFKPFEVYFQKCLNNAAWLLEEDGTVEPCTLRRSAGEYDLVTTIPSKYVTRLFCNPQIWLNEDWEKHKEDLRKQYNDNIDAFCSIFQPDFNKYIRYSFTRLTYQKENSNHLPSFVNQKLWETICDFHRVVSISEIQRSPQLNKRMQRIASIGCDEVNDIDKLKELLVAVQSYVPAVSNLSLELNQLFSDYTQCMCSSADGLWIDDYQQVFQEMLQQLCRLIKVLQQCDKEAGRWQETFNFFTDISGLIESIRRQINHISTSGKLFFREQETHFGYTAQHDLVLHAYYGIVKHLMEVIYSYCDNSVQSVLFPIVNFQPGDHIQSDIFFEESAAIYAHASLIEGAIPSGLHSRIMSIRIPLDGMNNLMYYLPMMVHEVFHYAAPWNRTGRNRLLANVMVYLALVNGIADVIKPIINQELEGFIYQKKINLEDQEQKEISGIQLRCILEITAPAIKTVIQENNDHIWNEIVGEFFAEEAVSLPDKMKVDLCNGQILRSWFIKWMENWLSDSAYGQYENDEDSTFSGQSGVSSLFGLLFVRLQHELNRTKYAPEHMSKVILSNCALSPEHMKELFAQIRNRILVKLGEALKSTSVAEDNDSLVQRYMIAIQECLEATPYQNALVDLDELFPDIAMVKLTHMSAAGYLLQIALDFDKKMYDYREVALGNLRLAGVLEWLIDQEVKKPEERQDKLEEHLIRFQKLYCSSYELASLDISSHKNKADKECQRSITNQKARKWADAFRHLIFGYSCGPNRQLRRWVRSLIEEQMLPCLREDRTETHSHSLQELFQIPYHTYLALLERLWDNRDSINQKRIILKDLFHLSIDTILRFQLYHPLRNMNECFLGKKPVSRDSVTKKDVSLSGNLSGYTVRVMGENDYLHVIHKAWGTLNEWRLKEGIKDRCGMWYRGAANANYAVLPSGFVHFAEDVGERNSSTEVSELKDISFLQIQRHRYESFRYAAEGSVSGISPAVYRGTLDYLTLMQHYNQRGNHHTNLMDWSEDFFAATYFALETQIDRNDGYQYWKRKEEADELTKPHTDAVLYILDPIHFNHACREIEQDSPFIVSDLELSGEVPNLSIPENQQRMEEYHNLYPGNNPKTPCDKPMDWMVISPPAGAKDIEPVTLLDVKQYGSGKMLKMHLPRAVYVAKLNNRIQAQSGLFIAYSLMSNPVVWAGKEFETNRVNDASFRYQSLESIQNYYLRMPGKPRSPFLIKIVIPSSMKGKMGERYHNLGLSREVVYPELDNNHVR